MTLLAVSDLHVSYAENRDIVERIRPGTPEDWLIVAGDLAEYPADVEWALGLLADRFEKVIWTPGNHELWTMRDDPVRLRGVERYQHLVDICRRLGVDTPEDPYPVWTGPGGPLTVAPLFVGYDYSFLTPGTRTREASMQAAEEAGVVCTDEFFLHPDPYADRAEWCAARIAYSESRLAALDPDVPTVLVNHYPLVRQPTAVLRYPSFAQWCGTTATADWHRRFRAQVVVYGHLHIPRTTWHDGVRFEEVSLGYPREWKHRPAGSPVRAVLKESPEPAGGRAAGR